MNKTRSERNYARENAARARKRPLKPALKPVIDWDRAWDRLEAVFAELYGDETPEKSTGTVV